MKSAGIKEDTDVRGLLRRAGRRVFTLNTAPLENHRFIEHTFSMLTRKSLSIVILLFFLVQTVTPARAELALPPAGQMVGLSPIFNPPVLKGLKVYPKEPLRFDFILDKGDDETFTDEQVKSDSDRLIKYFLASLTIPEKDLWVNLSPYEKDRIIPEAFGQTEMGRDLLAQDYILKQIAASLLYPEGETGKAFWKKVYALAQEKYGTTDVPVETFYKVWIVPEKAVVYENAKAGAVYITDSRLKVMLETDYLAEEKAHGGVSVHRSAQGEAAPRCSESSSSFDLARAVLGEIVVPVLEKEVNEGQNFAQLRQVYQSLILATWYKKKIKKSLLSSVYVDRNKTAGVSIDDTKEAEKIWGRYVEAFKKGAYNLVREENDAFTNSVLPRKYFLGGWGGRLKQLDFSQDVPKLSGNPIIEINVSLDRAGQSKTSKPDSERFFYFIKQAGTVDAFWDLIDILDHGFRGNGRPGYANVTVLNDHEQHWRMVDRVARASRLEPIDRDGFGIAMDVNKEESKPAEGGNWRGLGYVSPEKIKEIWISINADTEETDFLTQRKYYISIIDEAALRKRIQFYRDRLGKYRIPVRIKVSRKGKDSIYMITPGEWDAANFDFAGAPEDSALVPHMWQIKGEGDLGLEQSHTIWQDLIHANATAMTGLGITPASRILSEFGLSRLDDLTLVSVRQFKWTEHGRVYEPNITGKPATVVRISVPATSHQSNNRAGVRALYNELVNEGIMRKILAESMNVASEQIDLIFDDRGLILGAFPVVPVWTKDFLRGTAARLEIFKYIDFTPYYFDIPQSDGIDLHAAWTSITDDIKVMTYILGFYKDSLQESGFWVDMDYGNAHPFYVLEFNPERAFVSVTDMPDPRSVVLRRESLLESGDPFWRVPAAGSDVRRHILTVFPTVYSPVRFAIDDINYHRLLLSGLSLKEGDRVLVNGCGSGLETLMISMLTRQDVYALDINPLAVANAEYVASRSNFVLHARVSDRLVRDNGEPVFPGIRFKAIVWNAPSINRNFDMKDQQNVSVVAYHDGVSSESMRRFAKALPDLLELDGGVALIWGRPYWVENEATGIKADMVEMLLQSAGEYDGIRGTPIKHFKVQKVSGFLARNESYVYFVTTKGSEDNEDVDTRADSSMGFLKKNSDQAMPNNGGIDLDPGKMNLNAQKAGGEIKFDVDPAQLQQMQNAAGFSPVIIGIHPLNSLNDFLGLADKSAVGIKPG